MQWPIAAAARHGQRVIDTGASPQSLPDRAIPPQGGLFFGIFSAETLERGHFFCMF